MEVVLQKASYIVHATAWIILCVMSYATAGHYSFASCWPVLLIYAAPLFFPVAGIAILSTLGLMAALVFPSLRGGRVMMAAIHGEILVAGPLACGLVAYVSAGQVNCL